jgi:hypothetical protein
MHVGLAAWSSGMDYVYGDWSREIESRCSTESSEKMALCKLILLVGINPHWHFLQFLDLQIVSQYRKYRFF